MQFRVGHQHSRWPAVIRSASSASVRGLSTLSRADSNLRVISTSAARPASVAATRMIRRLVVSMWRSMSPLASELVEHPRDGWHRDTSGAQQSPTASGLVSARRCSTAGLVASSLASFLPLSGLSDDGQPSTTSLRSCCAWRVASPVPKSTIAALLDERECSRSAVLVSRLRLHGLSRHGYLRNATVLAPTISRVNI